MNAAAQNFNSIGIAFGSLMAFSSYNRFDNRIMRDTLIISLTDAFTCILAGICVFGTLGNLAYEQGKSVDEVVSSGKLNLIKPHKPMMTAIVQCRSWSSVCRISCSTGKNAAASTLVIYLLCHALVSWYRQSICYRRSNYHIYERCLRSLDPQAFEAIRSARLNCGNCLFHLRIAQCHAGNCFRTAITLDISTIRLSFREGSTSLL